MKALLINKYFKVVGGTETYLFSLANALKFKGIDVVYFAMQSKENIPCNTENFFVKERSASGSLINKFRLVKNLCYSKESFRKLNQLIEAEKPDFAVLNLIHKNLTCSVIDVLKRYNIPIFRVTHDLIFLCPVYTMINGEGHICRQCVDKKKFSPLIKNKCVRGSLLLSCLAYREANFIKKHSFYDKVDCFIAPSIFYFNILKNSKFTKSKICFRRNLLGPNLTLWDSSCICGEYFIYYGRLSKEKGIKTLIKAVKEQQVLLKIVGSGPEYDDLCSYVKENNLENLVKFLGFKSGEELKTLIIDSKAVILPSEWYENAPYSAMEAMALSKPLIVSSMGGLPELVINDFNGYVYNNFSELCYYLKKFQDISYGDYMRLSTNALKFAKKEFDFNDYVDFLLNEYTLIKGGK